VRIYEELRVRGNEGTQFLEGEVREGGTERKEGTYVGKKVLDKLGADRERTTPGNDG